MCSGFGSGKIHPKYKNTTTYEQRKPPAIWYEVRVPIKTNFVGSSIVECVLVGALSSIKLVRRKRQSMS